VFTDQLNALVGRSKTDYPCNWRANAVYSLDSFLFECIKVRARLPSTEMVAANIRTKIIMLSLLPWNVTGRGEDYGRRETAPSYRHGPTHLVSSLESLGFSHTQYVICQNTFFRGCRHDGMIDFQHLVQASGHDSSPSIQIFDLDP